MQAEIEAHRARQRPAILVAVRRVLGEPLLQFLVLGTALFAAYSYFEPGPGTDEDTAEIRLTPEDVLTMWTFFESQWQRQPTPDEFSQMVENKVREEVLYREALAMGLDQGDIIVKRRMAQKMQFLAEDVAAAYEPDASELRAWYEANADKFALPGRISFRQVYFSPDRRGKSAYNDAAAALAELAGHPNDAELASTFSDPFMLQRYYADRTSEQIAREFGPVFAQALARTDAGRWQGPIESGFGWHLVFVDSIIPGRQPAFSEVESEVKTAWLGTQKAQAWQKAYDEMRAKYTVVLPLFPDKTIEIAQPAAAPGATDAGGD